MELSESEDSHNSDDLGVQFVDTPGSDNDGDLGGGGYVNGAVLLGVSSLGDFLLNSFVMLFVILLGFFEDFGFAGLIGGSSIFSLFLEGGLDLGVSFFFELLSFGLGSLVA